MKRLILALTLAAMGMLYSAMAEAFTKTLPLSMNVSATLAAACTVATTPMNFGTYDGTFVAYSTSTITVNCSSGKQYRVDIDAGLNYFNSTRRIKSGTSADVMPYTVYKDVANTLFWGDNGTTFCTTCTPVPTGLSATGTGASQVHTVYGTMASSTATTLGVYTDTVTVTVNY